MADFVEAAAAEDSATQVHTDVIRQADTETDTPQVGALSSVGAAAACQQGPVAMRRLRVKHPHQAGRMLAPA